MEWFHQVALVLAGQVAPDASLVGRAAAQSNGPPWTSNEKFAGLARMLGQLQASSRGAQSIFGASLHNLGQPCEFRVPGRR